MPGLTVALNGKELATVSAKGFNLLNVRVAGDRISDEFANLDVSGGLDGEGKQDQNLIGVDLIPLKPGDEVDVTFLDTLAQGEKL